MDELDNLLDAALAARSEPVRALALAEQARALAEALGRPERMARALLAEADAHYFGGHAEAIARSSEAACHARRLAAEIADREIEAAALARLSRAANQQSDLGLALTYSQQRLVLARDLYEEKESGAALALAEALNGAAVIHLSAGDYLAAEPLLTEALRRARESGQEKIETIVLSNMGVVKGAAGAHAEAAVTFAEVAQRHTRRGDQAARIKALANVAENALAEERFGDAQAACVEALETAEAFGIHQSVPSLQLLQGKLLRLRGLIEEANAALTAGYNRASAAGDRYFLPLLRAEQGLVASARGDHETGLALLNEALILSGETKRSADVRDIYGSLAEVAERSGDHAAALRYHREYHRLSQKLEAAAADRRMAVSLAALQLEKAESEAKSARQEAEALRRHQGELHATNRALADANRALANADAEKEALLDQLRAQTRRLADMANRDSLTGVYNRRFLDRILVEMMTQRDGAPISVAVIDLDNFKSINDRFSHETGDFVLRMAARLLRDSARAGDVLARFGGEEFVLVLPGLSAVAAVSACERLRLALASYPWHDLHPDLIVTASIGVADTKDADTPARLLAAADERLYRAKTAGKDRVFV